MLFRKHNPEVDTPFGTGKVVSGTVYVSWVRHRGVKIGLCWAVDKTPDERLVGQIESRLDFIVDQGLARLGSSEFPDHLKAVLPEWIDLDCTDGDFSLTFYCPDDEDYLLGVEFKDWKIIRDWEGH